MKLILQYLSWNERQIKNESDSDTRGRCRFNVSGRFSNISGLLISSSQNEKRKLYAFEVIFPNIRTVSLYSPVRYRGVIVGRVVDIKPQTNEVKITLQINHEDLLIPKTSSIYISRTPGVFDAEEFVSIVPNDSVPEIIGNMPSPTDPECDSNMIICTGDNLKGEAPLPLW
ncbi:MAG: MlaD family protein [Cyanobacteria bacterium P01_H01_bin.162]